MFIKNKPATGIVCLFTLFQMLANDLHVEPTYGQSILVTNPTSLEKVLPTKGETGPKADSLWIAMSRGEFEPVQIVVEAQEKALQGVRVSASTLIGPWGNEISDDRIVVNPIGFIHIESPARGWSRLLKSEGGEVPDVLLPDRAMDVSAGRRQPFYVTVRSLHTDPAGEYRGVVTVSADGEPPIELPLVVRIYDVALPIRSHLRTSFGLDSGYRKIEDANAGKDLDSLLRFAKFMLEHRISPCVYGSSWKTTMVPPRKGENGAWDFSGLDRYLSELVPLGLTTYYTGTMGGTYPKPGDTTYAEHLKKNGWWDLAFVYMYDEAPMKKLPRVMASYDHLINTVPGVKLVQVGWSPTKVLEGLVNMWCPLLSHADLDGLRTVRERGEEVWWYTWDGPWSPYPNICHIDDPGIFTRITGWMTYFYQIQGFLYWSVDVWDTHPNRPAGGRLTAEAYDAANYANWKPNTYGKTSYGHPRNGDGYLLYPGKGNTPVASLRLAMVRDGFEDYDLFKEVETLVSGDGKAAGQAQALLEFNSPIQSPIIISRTKWTRVENDLLRHREEILKIAEALRKPDDQVLQALRDQQTSRVSVLYPATEKKK